MATSSELKLSFKYPPQWQLEKLPQITVVSSYPTAVIPWPAIRAKLEIIQQPNPKKLTNEQWYQQLRLTAKTDYTATTTTISIAGLPALARTIVPPRTDNKNLTMIIYLAKNTLLYEFNLTALGDKDIYQTTLQEILNTLKFNQ